MIDYTDDRFAHPKDPGQVPKRRRARRRKKGLDAAAIDRANVFCRQGQVCFAFGVSPTCRRVCDDPHELIPVSKGGPRESWNRVGLCRACHREAQGLVGGNRLRFRWRGQKPNADQTGDVSCYWVERIAR